MIEIEIVQNRTEHQTRTVAVRVPVDVGADELEQYVEDHALLERDATPWETVEANASIADWRPLGVVQVLGQPWRRRTSASDPGVG
jgi:hypothetical protein